MDWQFMDVARDFNPGAVFNSKHDRSYHIVISDEEILSKRGVHPWRPLDQDEWRWLGLDVRSELFLGEINGVPIFACEVDPESDNPDGYEFETLWSFLGQVDEAVFHLIGRARQIIDWNRNHRYCGQCGGETRTNNTDRSRVCDACRLPFFPRLSPSVIVLVTKGDEILLARNAKTQGNFYSTLAGFIEPGETLEDAVHREVFEEVGLHIQNLQYFSSQAWPFPNSLMFGFHAEYSRGAIVLQQSEIADARWFPIDALPHRPANFSISGWLIDDYIKRRRQLDPRR